MSTTTFYSTQSAMSMARAHVLREDEKDDELLPLEAIWTRPVSASEEQEEEEEVSTLLSKGSTAVAEAKMVERRSIWCVFGVKVKM